MRHAATTLGLLLASALLAGCANSQNAPAGAPNNWVGEGPAPAIEADRRFCSNLVKDRQIRDEPATTESDRRSRARSNARAYNNCMEARGWSVR